MLKKLKENPRNKKIRKNNEKKIYINREIQNVRKVPKRNSKAENTMTKFKNPLEGFNNRLKQAGESISKHEGRSLEIIESMERKNEEKLTELKGLVRHHQEEQYT